MQSLAAPVLGVPDTLGIRLPSEDRANAHDPIQFPSIRIPLVGLLDAEQQSRLNKALHNVLSQLLRSDTAKLFHEPVD